MTEEDFLFLARLVRRLGGLALNEGKGAKLEERLKPVVQRFGLRDGASLVAQLRLGQTLVVGEPVVGIEHIVAQILKGRAVKSIRAAPGDYRYLRPRAPAEFRSEGPWPLNRSPT